MSDRTSIADIIEKLNSEFVISHNISPNFLVCCTNTNGSESTWLREPVTGTKTKLVLNYQLKGRKTEKYFCFTIKNNVAETIAIPQEAEIKVLKSDKINTYISFYEWNDNVVQFIKDVMTYYVENFEPSDKFGCCSKYVECSKAGKCLHENKFYAKACWYRKNLESGKIFYT